MNTINDGGPAFPVPNPDHQTFSPKTVKDLKRLMSGMSLRDYYAGEAMNGELCAMRGDGLDMDLADESLERLTRHWFRIADAMLKAREHGTGPAAGPNWETIAHDLLTSLESIAGFAPGNGDVCEIIAKRARGAMARFYTASGRVAP